MINKKIGLNDEKILYKKFCLRLHPNLRFFNDCCVLNCNNIDIEVHFIHKLHRVHKIGDNTFVIEYRSKQVKGLAVILSTLNRKYICICSKHYLEFEADKFSPLCFKTIKFTLGVNFDNLNNKKLFYI